MRLPSFKCDDVQAHLWDEPMGNHGHARTVIGDFAERLTAKLFKGRRYKTDSTADYCPDVFALGSWFEVKASGRTNQTFVYAGRLEKDRAFAEDRPLFYVVWHHAADTRGAASRFGLQCEFLRTLKAIYVVEFAEVLAIAETVPVTRLNSKYGHSDSNPTYGAGYRIPLNRIVARPHLSIGVERLWPERTLFA